ncbi:MAG: DUF1330 domain-containing protein [Candidatus Binatia bacterium]
MPSQILILAQLFIHPGREGEFRRFETEAARIMRKHGGCIERVIRPTVGVQEEALPYEVHLLSFPSMEQFTAYRADVDLAKLTDLRQSAIARTEVIIGEEGEPYL